MRKVSELKADVRRGILFAALAMIAGAQGIPSGETVSITDSRPLAVAAEILMSHYGVPISYEDIWYGYGGDLAESLEHPATHALAPSRMRGASHVAFTTLAPKKTSLMFFAEPLKVSIFPQIETADPASVARILQELLNQHERNGNPGTFKLMETVAGLAIVPKATRDASGAFIPDPSILDLRVSFPETNNPNTVLTAIVEALSQASGKQIEAEGFDLVVSGRVGARNEVARDVLARLLTGLVRYGGINEGRPVPKLVWNLTMYPGIDPQHEGKYHLGFRKTIMEGRDKSGHVFGRAVVLPGTSDPLPFR